MKKKLITFLLLLFIFSCGSDVVFGAYSSYHGTSGVTVTGEYSVEYFEPGISSKVPEGGYVYTFVTYGYIDADAGSNLEFIYDSVIEYIGGSNNTNLIKLSDNKTNEQHGVDIDTGNNFCKFTNYYISDSLLSESEGYNYSCDLHFTVDDGYEYNILVYYELSGELPDGSNTNPEVTPEITPDIEEPEPEEPTPEITSDPTPTNTPTPTPTPGPILELNAFVTSKDAVAQYKTGGCTPIRSTIEFYEVDTSADILTKVNSEEFLSGTGTMRNTMTPGKVYRYKLTYVFQRDGIQYEKFLWSDDLTIIDQELEDYRSNKKITNFRTLMLYVWEDVMKLEIPIEGFYISFQSLFIWVMVAVVLIWFIKKYNR